MSATDDIEATVAAIAAATTWNKRVILIFNGYDHPLDVQPVCRAREAALLGDGDEGGELPQLHARSLSLTAITVSSVLR